jgi:hypothetical protein
MHRTESKNKFGKACRIEEGTTFTEIVVRRKCGKNVPFSEI